MKAAPPQPGWIERLYRRGVGIAIPVTIIAGLVLLLTARDPNGTASSQSTPKAPPQVVLMAEPLQDQTPSVLLKPPADRPCPPPPAGATGVGCRSQAPSSAH